MYMNSSDRRRPEARVHTLERHSKGLIALSGCRRGAIPAAILARQHDRAMQAAEALVKIFGKRNFYIELQHPMTPGAAALNSALIHLASSLGVGVVATNNVHYTHKSGFELHDVLTCIRTLTTLDDIHPEAAHKRGELSEIRSPDAGAFRARSEAVVNTLAIAERCSQA